MAVVAVVEVELVFSMDAIAVRHLPTEGNGVAEFPDLRRNIVPSCVEEDENVSKK